MILGTVGHLAAFVMAALSLTLLLRNARERRDLLAGMWGAVFVAQVLTLAKGYFQ